MKNQFKILCGAVALAITGHVSAATDWVLTSPSATATATPSPGGFTTTAGGSTVIATGYADTGAGNPMILEQQTAPGNFRQYTGGLGINNNDGCATGGSCGDPGDVASTAPEHAIDNQARYEMVLLSFSKSVELTNAKFGWVGTDSDYTVLAYTGAGAPTLKDSTWAAVKLDSAWNKIGSYSNAATGVNNSINAGNVYSSYWLIGAYNPLAGTDNGYSSTSYDYVKLASVSGNVCTGGSGPNCARGQVPEPGSLALFGIALIGMLSLNKRLRA